MALKRIPCCLAIAFLALSSLSLAALSSAAERQWTSKNGLYGTKGTLIAFNDKSVVLKDAENKLITLDVSDLSELDRLHLDSLAKTPAGGVDQLHVWTSDRGMKVRGKVVAYGKKQLTVQFQLGRVLVNNQDFDSLSSVQQQLVLPIVSHLENREFDEASFRKWAAGLGAQIKSYPLSGVLMELESGDVVGIPFFLFDQRDQQLLEPGWNSWLASASDQTSRSREDLMVEARAREYQNNNNQMQQIEMMKLEMMARATGMIKVWQVNLVPIQAPNARPVTMMVTANDSATASQIALNRYPGFRVASVKRSRRWYPTP